MEKKDYKEYIEREAGTAYAPLPKHLREYQTMNLDDAWEDGYDFAIKQIEAIPAADVRPVVHGRWIQLGRIRDGLVDDHDFEYKCSECSYSDIHSENVEVPYCWHCGAKMD